MIKKNNFFYLLINNLRSRFSNFEKNFSFALAFLFFGFLFGNLFGTILNSIREIIYWDGFILIIVITFFEFFNFILYKNKKLLFLWENLNFTSQFNQKKNIKKIIFLQNLNYFKLGLIFGFFIDAFKVGS